jgi:hypothetical protein
LPEEKTEFWQFIIGIKQNISIDFLNDFIKRSPHYIQFYLLRLIFKFNHENVLTNKQVRVMLDGINFADLNSKLFLIFLKNHKSDFDALKSKINAGFKESLNNKYPSELYILRT